MVDGRMLRLAIIVGTTLEVANVLLRHLQLLGDYYAQFGGMFIAGVAGLLYAREVDRGYRAGAVGGAAGGFVCATIGVALAVTLKDARPILILVAIPVCTLIGAIGGLFGQLGADIRQALYPKR